MTTIQIAERIESLIADLRRLCADLEPLANEMAQSMAMYDKAIRTRILELKSEGTQTTICEKIAKGDCHKELLDKELKIALYKIKLNKIECARASLNGYQSINKHLAEM